VERGAASDRHAASNAEHQLLAHEASDDHGMLALGALREIKKMEETHSIAALVGAAGEDALEVNAMQMEAQDFSMRRRAQRGRD
jgi:hypothetical protein